MISADLNINVICYNVHETPLHYVHLQIFELWVVPNLVPRFSLLPVERPWLGLVTWFQNKINSEGGVPCLSIFLCGSFSSCPCDHCVNDNLLSLQL